MTVKTALAALALIALPAMSFATCFGKEHQAQSCVAGTAWDAEKQACISTATS